MNVVAQQLLAAALRSLGDTRRRSTATSCGRVILNFLRNRHTFPAASAPLPPPSAVHKGLRVLRSPPHFFSSGDSSHLHGCEVVPHRGQTSSSSLFKIKVWLIYSVAPMSAAQQSVPVTHTHTHTPLARPPLKDQKNEPFPLSKIPTGGNHQPSSDTKHTAPSVAAKPLLPHPGGARVGTL